MILTYAALPCCCCCYLRTAQPASPRLPLTRPLPLAWPMFPPSLSLSLLCPACTPTMPCHAHTPLSTIHHKRHLAQLNYCMIVFFLIIFFKGGKSSQLAIFFPKWLCVCFCCFSSCHFFQKKDFFSEKLSSFFYWVLTCCHKCEGCLNFFPFI